MRPPAQKGAPDGLCPWIGIFLGEEEGLRVGLSFQSQMESNIFSHKIKVLTTINKLFSAKLCILVNIAFQFNSSLLASTLFSYNSWLS